MPHQVAGRTYQPHLPHRNGAPHKSQWKISVDDEIAAFELAVTEDWANEAHAWGLHLNRDGEADYLGVSPADHPPQRALFIALYELDAVCHGYPVDHQRSNREKPPTSVLNSWLNKGAVPAPAVRKIARGQRCRL